MLAFPTWWPADKAKDLEPVDDVMKVLLANNGAVSPLIEYLGPSRWPLDRNTRHAGQPDQGPCGAYRSAEAARWPGRHQDVSGRGGAGQRALRELDLGRFLAAAEKCHKAGVPFGIGLGQTADSVDSMGALFSSFGAELVDAKGNITVKSDAVKQVLEYMKKLVPVLPPDVFAWDDASNNKWLISGKGALIMNPPSAWAVAKRDNPKVAEQLWTFPSPRGPEGTRPALPALFLGHLEVLPEQGGGQEPACSTSRSVLQSRRWLRQARAMTFRPSPS